MDLWEEIRKFFDGILPKLREEGDPEDSTRSLGEVVRAQTEIHARVYAPPPPRPPPEKPPPPDPSRQGPEVITIGGTAELLGVKPYTVRKMLAEHKLPVVAGVGSKHIRIDAVKLRLMIAKGEVGGN